MARRVRGSRLTIESRTWDTPTQAALPGDKVRVDGVTRHVDSLGIETRTWDGLREDGVITGDRVIDKHGDRYIRQFGEWVTLPRTDHFQTPSGMAFMGDAKVGTTVTLYGRERTVAQCYDGHYVVEPIDWPEGETGRHVLMADPVGGRDKYATTLKVRRVEITSWPPPASEDTVWHVLDTTGRFLCSRFDTEPRHKPSEGALPGDTDETGRVVAAVAHDMTPLYTDELAELPVLETRNPAKIDGKPVAFPAGTWVICRGIPREVMGVAVDGEILFRPIHTTRTRKLLGDYLACNHEHLTLGYAARGDRENYLSWLLVDLQGRSSEWCTELPADLPVFGEDVVWQDGKFAARAPGPTPAVLANEAVTVKTDGELRPDLSFTEALAAGTHITNDRTDEQLRQAGRDWAVNFPPVHNLRGASKPVSLSEAVKSFEAFMASFVGWEHHADEAAILRRHGLKVGQEVTARAGSDLEAGETYTVAGVDDDGDLVLEPDVYAEFAWVAREPGWWDDVRAGLLEGVVEALPAGGGLAVAGLALVAGRPDVAKTVVRRGVARAVRAAVRPRELLALGAAPEPEGELPTVTQVEPD